VGGIASLVGTWSVYASHHTSPQLESEDAFFGSAALAPSSGTLVLKMASNGTLTGMLTDFMTGQGQGESLGPEIDRADLVAGAFPNAPKAHKCAPEGAIPAQLSGYSLNDRWQPDEDDVEPFAAWLDLRAGGDDLVPRMKFDGDAEDAEAAEAELPSCIDHAALPLHLQKGDLRLKVCWKDGWDTWMGIDYLLRRVTMEDGTTGIAPSVSPPTNPQSWDEYNEYRGTNGNAEEEDS